MISSIAFSPNGTSGYFVSNRADTMLKADSAQNNDPNDDIFSFEMIEKAVFNNNEKSCWEIWTF